MRVRAAPAKGMGPHLETPQSCPAGGKLPFPSFSIGCCKPFAVFHSFNSVGSDSYYLFFFVSVRLENVEPPYFAILLTSHCGFDLHFPDG